MPHPLLPTALFGNTRPPFEAANPPEAAVVPFARVLGERLPAADAPAAADAADATAAVTAEAPAAEPDAANTAPATAPQVEGAPPTDTIDPALAAWLEQILPPVPPANDAQAPAISDAVPAISAATGEEVAPGKEKAADADEPPIRTDPLEAAHDVAVAMPAVAVTPVMPPAGDAAQLRTEPRGNARSAAPTLVAALSALSASTAAGANEAQTANPVTAAVADEPAGALTTPLPQTTSDIAAAPSEPADDFAALIERATSSTPTTSSNGSGTTAAQAARHADAIVTHQTAGSPAWQNEVGDRMVWMAGTQRAQADLVLNPPQLGRIEVSLTVVGDQASAVFGSPNATVREMLENSLPRLREILAGAGIDLSQADVNAGSAGQSGQDGEQRKGDNRAGDASVAAAASMLREATGSSTWTRGGNALVDTFA